MRIVACAVTLLLVACSGDAPKFAASRQAIISGTASPPEQDFVVQITRAINNEDPESYCSGALVAKNIVITARHCTGSISESDQTVLTFQPKTLGIFVGQDASSRSNTGSPDAHAARIVAVGADHALYPDIALLVLDHPLDAPTVSMRLTGGAVKGEKLDIVGFGITEANQEPSARLQRAEVTTTNIAPESGRFGDLAPGEFVSGEASCSGDSGGPALASATGAIVGLVSRGGNGVDNPHSVQSCEGTTAEDIYTGLVPAKAVIDATFADAGAEEWLEGDISPEQKAADAADASANAAKAADKTKDDGGCSASGGSPSNALYVVLALSCLRLSALRARARSSRARRPPRG